MTSRRGVEVAPDAPEFAAMIESIILRCVSSASFAFAIESRNLDAATRFATASAMRTESARVMTGGGVTACGATGAAGGLIARLDVSVTTVTGFTEGGAGFPPPRVTT